MAVVAMMVTPGGNHAEINRVIGVGSRKIDLIYVCDLNGETMSFPAEDVYIYAKEKRG